VTHRIADDRSQKSLLFTSGPACPSCKQPLGIASVQVQLQMQIREHISKYYLGWTICDDPTCGSRTRMMSVYGKRCLKAGCLGRVSFEVSGIKLVIAFGAQV
jgi:DNA polymerase alpha subunit A